MGIAESITLTNGPLILINQGPFPVCLEPLSSKPSSANLTQPLIRGLEEIVEITEVVVNQAPGTPPITLEADTTLIFDSFRAARAPHAQTAVVLG